MKWAFFCKYGKEKKMKSINCAEFMSKKIVFSHGHQFTSVLQKAFCDSSAVSAKASSTDVSSNISSASRIHVSCGAKPSSLDVIKSGSSKTSLGTISALKNCRSKKEF